jgi:hypothetical protein
MPDWGGANRIETKTWRCGFCGRDVASDRGWSATGQHGVYEVEVMWLAICPKCSLPSLIDREGRTEPPPLYGESVEHLPDDVGTLFAEARRAVHTAPSSTAYACRKLLMHVAVDNGAQPNLRFIEYVDYLEANGHVPPGAKPWVDEIRQLGNDANHDIALLTNEEAKTVVDFTAMLLRLAYEYPERGRLSAEARRAKDATTD